MSLQLIISSGPMGGKRIWVNNGQTLQVGRTELADFTIESDKLMSRLHFAIDCEPDICRIRDIGSRNGTFVNGTVVKVATLADGDKIVAGETEFQVQLKSDQRAATGTGRKSWTKDRLKKKTVTAPPPTTGNPPAEAGSQSPIILDDAQRQAVQTFMIGPPQGASAGSIDELTMAVPLKLMDDQAMVRPASPKPLASTPGSKGLRIIGNSQGNARPLDLARVLTSRPDFYILINVMNMEAEARSFFLSPIQGKKFSRVNDTMVMVSTADDIDSFELYRRAWGRDAMIGLISQAPRNKIVECVRNYGNAFSHPSALRHDIERSPPEGVKIMFAHLDAVLVEIDSVDSWLIFAKESSGLDLQSLGLSP